jgi:hypothetical protein
MRVLGPLFDAIDRLSGADRESDRIHIDPRLAPATRGALRTAVTTMVWRRRPATHHRRAPGAKPARRRGSRRAAASAPARPRGGDDPDPLPEQLELIPQRSRRLYDRDEIEAWIAEGSGALDRMEGGGDEGRWPALRAHAAR